MDAFLPPLPLLLFAGLWIGIARLIARVGWRHLAQAYATDRPLSGRRIEAATVGINGGRYSSGTVRLRVTRQGLGMRVPFFFAFGHPPLLIPWSAVQDAERKGRRSTLLVSLPDASQDAVRIILPTHALEEIMMAMNAAGQSR